MAERQRRRVTLRTAVAAVLAFAGAVLFGVTADQILTSDLAAKNIIGTVLLVLALASIGFGIPSFRSRRTTGYILLVIGFAAIVLALVILAAMPEARASAIPGVSTWLSALIPGVLLMLAGVADISEAKRSVP